MSLNVIIIWSILKISASLLVSKTINSTNEEDNLLQFHLQLHRNHCGDVALCDNVTDHVDRLDFVTPVPCCLPCSCSPTCGIQHNCCLGFGLHTKTATYIEARRDLSKPNHANQLNNVDVAVSQSIEHTTVLNESRPMDLAEVVVNRHQEHRFERETFRTYNHTEEVQTLTDNAKLEKTSVGTTELKTICIRPQVFHSTNYFIDSKAYMMVAACFQGNKLVDKCRGGQGNTDMSDMIPVTSRLTGLTYVNRFCLMCNEDETLDASMIDVWEEKVVYYAGYYRHRFVSNPNALIDHLRRFRVGYFNIHFAPSTRNLVQQCEPYDVSSCNQTGLWEVYDEMIENVCHHGPRLPILHRVADGRHVMRFKNIACVHCNEVDSFNDTTLSCGYYNLTPNLYSYSQTLNQRGTYVGGKLTDKVVLQMSKTNECPSGYIALLVRDLLLLFMIIASIQVRTLLIVTNVFTNKNPCLLL